MIVFSFCSWTVQDIKQIIFKENKVKQMEPQEEYNTLMMGHLNKMITPLS